MSKVYRPASHERTYSHQNNLNQYHSKEQQDRPSQYYSTDRYQNSGPGAQLNTPPMTEDTARRPYEVHFPPRVNQEFHRTPDAIGGERLSLPPLRSILAEPERPIHHERNVSYTGNQDVRQTSGPSLQDRTPWHPFPARPSSSHYSLDNDQTSPKTELPPPSSLLTSLKSPGFPRSLSQEQSRSQNGLGSGSWTPRQEIPAREYFGARDNASLYRPSAEQHSAPPASQAIYRRESDARASFPTTSPLTPTYPATSMATPAPEPVTTKDGLGPKIWTGTQFLPRFVRQAEVAGEGMCYFYDDGTHCKTHIDGEAVNAHWGVTKAGKPRKRLAIACITCREKKIKCDPDYPRCVQCEKFGRTCRFKNAPRGGQGPESPPADSEDTTRPVSRSDAGSFEHEKGSHSVSPRTIHSHPSPEHEGVPAKRRRHDTMSFTPVKSEYELFHNTSPTDRQWAAPKVPRTKEPLTLKWPNNPYDADPALVKELVKVYFSNIASTAYSFIAEEPFWRWLTSSDTKSSDDILLIYALLAVATIWSPKPGSAHLGQEFAKIARYTSTGVYNLQVVQARLLFALYYESAGEPERSWDSLSGAVVAATTIRLHLEPTDSASTTYPIGLNKGSFKECSRRTFWSCYIMDRLGSYRNGRLSTISNDNIFLRMPCDNLAFNQEKDIRNPYFNTELDLTYNRDGTFGAMAYLVMIATIYGDIMGAVWRTQQGMKGRDSETFYDSATERLTRWYTSIPPCMTNTRENVAKITEFGLLGSFAAMHSVYRTAQIKLNSSLHASLHYDSPQPQLQGREDKAVKHAESLIRESSLLAIRQNQAIGCNEHACGKLPAFVGTAIFGAFRFLSATGSRRTMGGRMDDAEDVLKEVAQQWPASLKTVDSP